MGVIENSQMNDDGSGLKLIAQVPLANMFGYSTELRSLTQGKGGVFHGIFQAHSSSKMHPRRIDGQVQGRT